MMLLFRQVLLLIQGPVKKGEINFPHSMEPQLRQLGMPTSLVNGVVTLNCDYQICRVKDILTSNQANLLVIFLILDAF